ncbi:MAG: DUF2147 domain-containing protein [Saprospiraceae bacterium]
MKYLFFLTVLLLATPLIAQSPVGRWKTIDDETGKVRSIIEITQRGGVLEGKVTKIFPQPGDKANGICEECPGDKKGKPILGMTIMEGLKKDGDSWEGGTILDPKSGKVYSCYIKLMEADKLKLRGYVGVAMLGRTQYWLRVKE